jgi:hypothetical protein
MTPKSLLFLIFIFILSPLSSLSAAPQKIAILPIKNMQTQSITELSFLTDLIRSTASRLPTESYSIITQENVIALLPEGKTLEDCVSQSTCEVTMGRELGADYIITSEITSYGDEYRISMRLHQTKTAQLMATGIIPAKKITDFEKPLQAQTLKLLSKLDPNMAEQAERALQGIIYEKIDLVDPYEGKSIDFSKLQKININQEQQEDLRLQEIKGLDFSALDINLLKAYDFAISQDQSSNTSEQSKLEAWSNVLKLATNNENLARLSTERINIWKTKIGQIAYNETLAYDQQPLSTTQGISEAQGKIGKWRSLSFYYPVYREQAEQRIKEWENWIRVENEKENYFINAMAKMSALEIRRQSKMSQDWSRLSELLKLKVLPDAEKKKYTIAFIEAYGAIPSLNPYLSILQAYLPSAKTLDSIKKENLMALEQRLNILLKAKVNHIWQDHEIDVWKTIPFELIEKLGEQIINKANIPKSLNWYVERESEKRDLERAQQEQERKSQIFKKSKFHTDFPILPLFRFLYTYCPSCIASKGGIGFDYQIGYHFLKLPEHLLSIGLYLDSAFFGYFSNDSEDRGSLHFYSIPTIKAQRQHIFSGGGIVYYGLGIGLGYHTYSEDVLLSKDSFESYQSEGLAYKIGAMFGVRSIRHPFSMIQLTVDLLRDVAPSDPKNTAFSNCASCLYQINPMHVQFGINIDLLGVYYQ